MTLLPTDFPWFSTVSVSRISEFDPESEYSYCVLLSLQQSYNNVLVLYKSCTKKTKNTASVM